MTLLPGYASAMLCMTDFWAHNSQQAAQPASFYNSARKWERTGTNEGSHGVDNGEQYFALCFFKLLTAEDI